MIETQFVPYRPDHSNSLAALVKQLYTDDPGERPANPDVTLTIDHFERHPDKGRIVIFQYGEKVAGYAIIIYFWSNEFGGNIIEIDELLVSKDCRNMGIGKAFFDWLDKTYAASPGFALQTSPDNEGARRLYASVGFVSSRSHYMLKLRGEEN